MKEREREKKVAEMKENAGCREGREKARGRDRKREEEREGFAALLFLVENEG